MNKKIYLSKDLDEFVIRKAVYWLSDSCSWTLERAEEGWIVTLDESDDLERQEQKLHRLINDQLLRAKLDERTKGLRIRFVESALKKILE